MLESSMLFSLRARVLRRPSDRRINWYNVKCLTNSEKSLKNPIFTLLIYIIDKVCLCPKSLDKTGEVCIFFFFINYRTAILDV